jgi:general secretion pathway protein L
MFVESEADKPGLTPLITLRQDRGTQEPLLRRLIWGGILSALVLSVVVSALTYWRQQSLLDELDARIAAARPKAQHVRAIVDKLEQQRQITLQLRSRKTDGAGLLDIWEEVTRVLPADSWLTELRLSEGADHREREITMTGLSAAAASLVGLIDQSRLFTDASLTAPVTIDPTEGHERFALRARLSSSLQKSASR